MEDILLLIHSFVYCYGVVIIMVFVLFNYAYDGLIHQ